MWTKRSPRSCETMANRQADLSKKLSRAANPLRTRVDVEINARTAISCIR